MARSSTRVPRNARRPGESLDAWVRRRCEENPRLLVSHFLVHSYLYYVLDSAVVSDDTFDWIGRELAAKWETISHPHKDLIERDSLTAGSGFYLKDYPSIVVSAAASILKEPL